MGKIKMVVTDKDRSAVRYKNKPFNSGWDAIGDNTNDLDVLKIVGKPCVINPRPSVKDFGTEIQSYMEIKL